MSILERYGVPHQDFYQWHVENAEGYELFVEPTLWTPSRREIHKIAPLKWQGE